MEAAASGCCRPHPRPCLRPHPSAGCSWTAEGRACPSPRTSSGSYPGELQPPERGALRRWRARPGMLLRQRRPRRVTRALPARGLPVSQWPRRPAGPGVTAAPPPLCDTDTAGSGGTAHGAFRSWRLCPAGSASRTGLLEHSLSLPGLPARAGLSPNLCSAVRPTRWRSLPANKAPCTFINKFFN